MQETEAYITIKDHKESFPNKIPCRLINPSKSSVGKISKVILDKINNHIQKETSANQWKDTSSVIEWFLNIKEKERSSFMVFDIESFYPSITERLFNNAIQFAKQITEISDYDMSLINQSRKTLLFNEKIPWVKKEGSEDFDVPMGCFDGAEVCELVGTFILNKLKNVFQNNTFGLYRDDGLVVIKGLSGPEIERLKKNVVKTFKDCGLNITIETNLHTVNYLDVTFDLQKDTYLPYRKPDNPPVYINNCSNHPPTVIKQLPKSISKRLSDLSSNEEIFEKTKPAYSDAFKKSEFQGKLSYTSAQSNNDKNDNKQRKCKIIWYNPPYSTNIKTNIGKTFLNLIKKHFPKTNKLHKIFNKNTVKISYSCMSNISSIISGHNKNLLNTTVTQYGCNC